MQTIHPGRPARNGENEHRRHSRASEQLGDKSQGRRPHVVVLGAGFGGLWAARTLAEAGVDVTLIDRHNYHTFFPLLYQVAAAELAAEDIAQPLRKIFWRQPNVHIYQQEVKQIDFSNSVVITSDQAIPYDYLVIALGSKPNFYGISGVHEYAFTLKSLEEGIALRNHILSCFERAARETDAELRRGWLTFTIVGGGPTGVEFAGALMELMRGSLAKDYPELDFSQAQVVLVEQADHLLEGMPKSLSDYAKARLEKMGVDVRLQAPLIQVTPDEVLLKGNSTIASKTVVWTAGVQGNLPGSEWGLATNRRNQVEVLPTLQVPNHPAVYVVGDLAGIQQDARPLPMVAQVGIQSGTTAARNILRQIEGQSPQPFHYHDKGTLDVIGRNAAVAYIWGRSFRGFPAWVIWVWVHIFNLIGLRNRLLVLVNWAWAYLFAEHGVRLIVPSGSPAAKGPPADQCAEQKSAGREPGEKTHGSGSSSGRDKSPGMSGDDRRGIVRA